MRRALGLFIVVALVAGVLVTGTAGAAPSVRGFDGTTVKVASLGIAAQFPGVPVGAQARIKRFNDTNEIKGIKIAYDGFADDKQDPATALSETRRLVAQDGIFAIVGDTSSDNPGAYLKQQHVPYFGWAFDATYCSKKIDTSLYGFGYNGCLVPENPSVMPDNGRAAVRVCQSEDRKEASHPGGVFQHSGIRTGCREVPVPGVSGSRVRCRVAAEQDAAAADIGLHPVRAGATHSG